MNEAGATAAAPVTAPAATAVPQPTVFGQPRGLVTLFMTEMWERFTYYGMRAVLILYMVAAVSKGGMGLDDRTSSAIYGMYIGGTSLLGLLGGWIADRLIGAQRAVPVGAVLIIAGNLMLALGSAAPFFAGLLVITVGVGLLKPNASVMVAGLYPEGGARRDAGFSFFYMGINLGAFIGPFIVGAAAELIGWRWGFVASALGMAAGLVQYLYTRRYLGSAGGTPEADRRGSWLPVIALIAVVAVVAVLAMSGVLRLDAVWLSQAASWAMVALGVTYFAYLLFFTRLSRAERNRVLVMIALVAASVTFWAGYEQAGASMNLFADRYTNRHLFGTEYSAAAP